MVAAVPPPPSGSAGAGFWLGNLAVPWSASPSAASSLGVVPQPEAHVGSEGVCAWVCKPKREGLHHARRESMPTGLGAVSNL
jgi:hypothetical protein